jgi:hypothetical protein
MGTMSVVPSGQPRRSTLDAPGRGAGSWPRPARLPKQGSTEVQAPPSGAWQRWRAVGGQRFRGYAHASRMMAQHPQLTLRGREAMAMPVLSQKRPGVLEPAALACADATALSPAVPSAGPPSRARRTATARG